MEALLAVLILLAVAAFVLVPLRARAGAGEVEIGATRRELEARKESKYAEIRDAELDHAAGKLSDEDFRRVDRQLRAEAIEILKQLDALDA